MTAAVERGRSRVSSYSELIWKRLLSHGWQVPVPWRIAAPVRKSIMVWAAEFNSGSGLLELRAVVDEVE